MKFRPTIRTMRMVSVLGVLVTWFIEVRFFRGNYDLVALELAFGMGYVTFTVIDKRQQKRMREKDHEQP